MARIKLRLCFRFILIIAPILAGSTTKLNAQIPEAKTKPTGSVSGRVTIGEKPAPGVLVVVGNGNSATSMAQATSDADGNYRIGGLAAGQINVIPVAPVYVVPASAMLGQGRVINLSANETVEGVDFKLTRGGVITGRITDADGRPVIEERISLISVDENGAAVRGPTFRAPNFMMYQTDDRGIYRIYGLPAGHYKISVGDDAGRSAGLRAAGYYQRTYYPDAPDMAKAAIVDISEGGEAKNIDIKLGRRSSTYSVSGRIIEADTGKPLTGIFFSFGIVQQNQNERYVNGASGPGNPTNLRGEFRLEGLSAGRYVLMINSESFNPNATSTPKFYSAPVPFEVVDSDITNLEMKAQRGLSISGVLVPEGITDKSVLSNISRVIVTANVEPASQTIRVFDGGVSSRVNPDGSFVLEGLQPGKVSFNLGYSWPDPNFRISRIERDGGQQTRLIDLAPGQNVSGLKIFLAYGTGVVRGQLKVEGGILPSEAVIFIRLNRQGEQAQFSDLSGQVDSRGRFLIKGVAPGTYDVVLQFVSLGSLQLPRGFQRLQRQTVTVVDGADAEVNFTIDLSRKDVP